MSTIHIHRNMRASQERVFAALDDHANMGRWLGPPVSVVRQGQDGVGTIRRISALGNNLDEEIVERSAPTKIAYRIVAGMPGLKHHLGVVTVSSRGEGSTVDWKVELKMKIPGLATLLSPVLKQALGKGLARLDRQLS